MQIDEEDNIFIYDMLGRLQKISNMGQYINEYRLPMFILWFTIMSPEKILFSKVLDEVDGYKTDILHMSNYNGDIAFSFCKLEEFSELPMTKTFNITFGVKDNTNNVIVTFYSQNRIEKYNQNGKLIFRAKRKLNYDIFINEKREKVIGISGEKFKIPNYECSYVSSGIGIDYENNIWIITLIKQPSKEDLRTNTIEFEVYNSDGILITRVPIPEIYFDNFKIFDDDIFFLDSHETGAVYEYKIIKK